MINIKSHFKIGDVVYLRFRNMHIIKAYIAGLNFYKSLEDKKLRREYWVQSVFGDNSPINIYEPLPNEKIYKTLKEAEQKTKLKLFEMPIKERGVE